MEIRKTVFIINTSNNNSISTTIAKILKEYITYLQKPYGGYWTNDEICILKNASMEEFYNCIHAITDCAYCNFIIFAPHSKKENSFILNHYEQDKPIFIEVLKKSFQKGIFIIENTSEEQLNTITKIDNKENCTIKESMYAMILNRFECKTLYNSKNEEIPNQIIQINSSASLGNEIDCVFSYLFLKEAVATVKEKITTTNFYESFSFIRVPHLFNQVTKHFKNNRSLKNNISINHPEYINETNGVIFTIIA